MANLRKLEYSKISSPETTENNIYRISEYIYIYVILIYYESNFRNIEIR